MANGKFDMSEFLTPAEGVPESDTMREIAVDDILDNPLNFYPKPDKGKLGELMDSIRANGMLEPPTVVPAGNGKYRLISGHSRMEAVRALSIYLDRQIADRFQTVMCRVLQSMTPEQEECAVIEANRQRVKSPALLAEEAERLTKIYIKRREAGEELPGRIRDRVAEAMQVNKTKLANLSAIKRGLKVPGIVRKWEAGGISEAAALEIARMDDETQYRLLDWVIDNHRSYTTKDVQEFVKSRAKDEQAAEDEKYIELLGHIRERFERELRGCKNRGEGIETLKKAFRWAGGGSKEFDWQGEAKGLRMCGENRKHILRPWATVWDMLAAMSMQDDPSPTKAVSSPGWLPLDAEHWPEEGALVVLSYPTGLGGSAYLTARCGGSASDQYPFVSTDAGISVQDIVECQCDSWLLISERQRGENK